MRFCALVLALLASPFASAPATRGPRGEKRIQTSEARIRRIEDRLPPVPLGVGQPPLALGLRKLMELYNVPGLSLAVIDGFRIAWVRSYGVTEAGGTTPVTPQTLFQAGSVSKPVAAVGALTLVESGRLSLDEDVNGKLVGWKVPESPLTRDRKVTLRRILSHSAGTTVHFFPGYEAGQPIPSLTQILNGEKPANTAPVRVVLVPGTEWRYSGGGVLIEQQLMIDAAGKPFPEILRENVFDRIGMRDSTYEQPLPPERASKACSGTYANGKTVPGRWHVYPEMAAAGLWTTPSDLARLAIEVALASNGKSDRLLSGALAREMLTPQVDRVGELALGDAEHPDRMGLGFFLGDASRPDLFGHIGDDEGFQAMVVLFGKSGRGAAIMANSENGILLGDYLLEGVAKEYGWPYVAPRRHRIGGDAALLAVAREKGAAAAIGSYRILKKANAAPYVVGEQTLNTLGYALFASDRLADAIAVLKFAVEEYPASWNAYDSLAEMYAHADDAPRAAANYQKSLALNPGNKRAAEELKRLSAGTETVAGKWTGRVSDRECGRAVDPDCNRRCFARGVPPVLVGDDGEDVLTIANPESLTPYPGVHVEVTGTIRSKVLTVASVKVLQ